MIQGSEAFQVPRRIACMPHVSGVEDDGLWYFGGPDTACFIFGLALVPHGSLHILSKSKPIFSPLGRAVEICAHGFFKTSFEGLGFRDSSPWSYITILRDFHFCGLAQLIRLPWNRVFSIFWNIAGCFCAHWRAASASSTSTSHIHTLEGHGT